MEKKVGKARDDTSQLGYEKGTYRVRFSLGYFLPHFLALIVAGLGLLIFTGNSSGWKMYVSAVVFLFLLSPFIFLLWRTLPTIFDELKVFDNGFTYKGRRGLQSCLWSQIKDHNDILDLGNRLKITSIEKCNGEKISFAYKMRGLDLLFHTLSDFEYEQIPDEEKATAEDLAAEPRTLGPLKATYYVKRRVGDYIPLAAVLFVAVFGVGTFLVSRDILALFVCSLPPVIALVMLAWTLYSSRRDELKIFENGFTYQSRKELISCLWNEIEDYSLERRSSVISGVKKENGPWISFASEMQGLEDLRPYLRTLVKWTGPED